MKNKNIKHILGYLFLLLAIAGCEKDFLDSKPLDSISSDAVFKDKQLSQAYLFNIYDYMPCGYGAHFDKGVLTTSGYGITDLIDGSTDLSRSPSGWNESNSVLIPGMVSATANPFDDARSGEATIWAREYKAIRKVNALIEGLSSSSITDEAWKSRITGEARFLRSFFYFNLVRKFGDVPLITKPQSFENLDSLLVSRTPVSQVYDFIDSELATIAGQLPSANELPAAELGRATKEACWALAGRAMLYAKRYSKSAEYSQKVISSGAFQLAPDYNALFQSHGGNKEVIFEVLFDGNGPKGGKGHVADLLYSPPSITAGAGWGSQACPTEELVESYEMLNGKSITDPTSGYDPQNPYVGRDKRLAATVIYEGSVFRGKVIHTAYNAPDDGIGLIGRTITGYYLRKFMDESLPQANYSFGGSMTSWKELRLGEVLLNYAEAQNESAGPDQSVYNAINQVRSRAGLPGLPTGLLKTEMFSRIVQERKVELAFEGHRFWDLRRWGLAKQVLNGLNPHGILITLDSNTNQLNYQVFQLNQFFGIPTQVFLDRNYLLPINQTEIQINKNLVQNPGY